MSLKVQVATIRTHLDQVETHVTALEDRKIKASSAKGRLALQNIKREAQLLRQNISAFHKELPTKTRQPVDTPDESSPEPNEVEPEPTPVPVEQKKRSRRVKTTLS